MRADCIVCGGFDFEDRRDFRAVANEHAASLSHQTQVRLDAEAAMAVYVPLTDPDGGRRGD